MKPFAHAILSEEQKYFNYRLSGATMVTECAFGTLKGRFTENAGVEKGNNEAVCSSMYSPSQYMH